MSKQLSRVWCVWALAALVPIVGFAGGSVVADDDEPSGDVSFFGVSANRGFLGVHVRDDEDAGGLLVVDVVEESPAAAAGLKSGDLIASLGGAEIADGEGLTEELGEYDPGDEVVVIVLRDGKRQSFSVELGQRPGRYTVFGATPRTFEWNDENFQDQMRDMQGRLKGLYGNQSGNALFFSRPKLGVELVEVTPELREHLGGDAETGVLVGKVLSGMPAVAGGIEVGDLIVRVNDSAITGSNDLIHALADTDGTTVEIELIRDGRGKTLQIDIPESAEDDEPRGPRAGLFLDAPEIQVAIREAAAAAAVAARQFDREAMAEAQTAHREALAAAHATMRESQDVQREAMTAARVAMEQARAVQRQHQEQIREAIREAIAEAAKAGQVL